MTRPTKRKSLGQVACEVSVWGQCPPYTWSDLDRYEREQWHIIARAVAAEVRRRDKQRAAPVRRARRK